MRNCKVRDIGVEDDRDKQLIDENEDSDINAPYDPYYPEYY